jgi:hypothetical protein
MPGCSTRKEVVGAPLQVLSIALSARKRCDGFTQFLGQREARTDEPDDHIALFAIIVP